MTTYAQDEVDRAGQHAAALQVRRLAHAESAAIRYGFIGRPTAEAPVPPLASMVKGGRGGAVRLKLYLSLLWLARNQEAPYFSYSAQDWAVLQGLPDPTGLGARRVQDAFRWLEGATLVELDRRPGVATGVRLLDDGGTGASYVSPGIAMSRSKGNSRSRTDHRYIQLKADFWTNGWVVELSAAAIAMYLVVLHEQRGDSAEAVWIAPSVGQNTYCLSTDFRSSGFRELVDLGVLTKSRQAVHRGAFSGRERARNIYQLVPNAMAHVPKGRPGY